MRPVAFFMNGGAGRVICSIPALEKYAEETSDNFIIVCEGGMDMYKGHPLLHERAFDVWHKAIFEEKIKDMDIVSPEPYRVWEYYNQKCSLAQAFDILINNKGVRELPPPAIVLNDDERVTGHTIVKEVKEKTGKDKVIVLQPFGRGVQNMGAAIVDPSGRSIEYQNLISFIKKLSKDYAIILMTEMQFNFEHEGITFPVAQPKDINLRQWAGVINAADYFFGCDSVGQHIAYAYDKPGTIIVGSTFAENVSYPENPKFDIQDMGEGKRVYDPIRIMPDEVAQRNNNGIMLMNDAIEDVIIESLNNNFDTWVTPKTKVVVAETLEKLKAPTASPLKLIPGTSPVTTDLK
jgi:hypothetical protein